MEPASTGFKYHPRKGDRLGYVVITGDYSTTANRQRCILGRCDCGNERLFRVERLYGGSIKSCGCVEFGSKARVDAWNQKWQIDGDIAFVNFTHRDGSPARLKIDAADLPLVLSVRRPWRVNGPSLNRAYAYSRINRQTVFIHRLITNAPEGLFVDHVNHDTLDNRRVNLRVVTASENLQNCYAASTSRSGIKNVHWDGRTKKWRVEIGLNGVRIKLGRYKTIGEAAAVAEVARRKYHTHSPENSDIPSVVILYGVPHG